MVDICACHHTLADAQNIQACKDNALFSYASAREIFSQKSSFLTPNRPSSAVPASSAICLPPRFFSLLSFFSCILHEKYVTLQPVYFAFKAQKEVAFTLITLADNTNN
ncbi:MAG: hypothetical protein II970_02275 [Paludibacteraceae bacterium]|nr:hypothetical protein [Paludibacteraceae bacterium]